MIDVVQAAAKAKCPRCIGAGAEGRGLINCSDCGGLNLAWPSLSRDVPDFINGGYKRTPDVTLEKALECLKAEGYTSMEFCPLIPGNGWQLSACGAGVRDSKMVALTPREVLCAALLATIQ